jgi:Raf kinase inhibitor-like YbhB/YbcL family protein
MADQPFTLTTPSFQNGEEIPVRFTCDGNDVSPHLDWTSPPEGTKSFALVLDDPDAPSRTFTHWLLFNLPAETRSLPEGAEGLGTGGRNDFEEDGFGGPCPPIGNGEHRYCFHLYALDVETLDLPANAGRKDLDAALQGHVLGEAQLVGRFRRE